MICLVSLVLLAYLVGSIPSGYWFSKYIFGIDIQKHGSGNIGATNVARVLGSKKYFFLIFLLDFTKTYLCMFFSKLLLERFNCEIYYSLLFIAFALLIGNAFSIFLNFSGGKGVSTTFGILLSLSPLVVVASFFFSWLLLLLLFKRSDIASLTSISLTTLIVFILNFYSLALYPPLFFYVSIGVFIFFLHKKNLQNLLKKH